MVSIDDAESDKIKGGFTKNEIVEKSFVSGDRRGALSGQRGAVWGAGRAELVWRGIVGECVCAGFLQWYLWGSVL